jgi:predicted AAA+ superfamily ATPase
MLRRSINILKTNSFFLFGARGVGKTRLIKELFPVSTLFYIDLLDPEQADRYTLEPQALINVIKTLPPSVTWVGIDEVQKAPKLLDIVHRTIESDSKVKFALTGSSARKLKRGGANLLAGRAFTYNLFPLTAVELADQFSLDRALTWGTLPKAYLAESDDERHLFLRSYVHTYLREEIQIEQIVRTLEPFRRFLEIAAQSNGEIINFARIARDVGTTDNTVRSYYQILEDTLLGFFLEPFHTSVRKRQREAPKFYLFDCGIQRALSDRLTVPLLSSNYGFGKTFEHFVILELKRRSEYARNDFRFTYLRTKDNAEIDLIIERPGRETALVEIKSTRKLDPEDTRTLSRFHRDFDKALALCLSRDPIEQERDKVLCLPWDKGIRKILED